MAGPVPAVYGYAAADLDATGEVLAGVRERE